MASDNSAEKTEVLLGTDKIINRTLEVWAKTKERLDVCADQTRPSVLLADERMWEAYTGLKKRGVRLRFITEITVENISYCKKITQVAEVRHLDGVKGSFGISDGIEYGSPGNTQEEQVPTQLIQSNVKAFVEQQQYLFEILWSKAIPAEQKIKEIEEGIIPYQTRVLEDPDEIFKQIIHHLAESSSSGLSISSTFNGLRLAYNNFFELFKQILDNYKKGKGKGIKWVGTLDKIVWI